MKIDTLRWYDNRRHPQDYRETVHTVFGYYHITKENGKYATYIPTASGGFPTSGGFDTIEKAKEYCQKNYDKRNEITKVCVKFKPINEPIQPMTTDAFISALMKTNPEPYDVFESITEWHNGNYDDALEYLETE